MEIYCNGNELIFICWIDHYFSQLNELENINKTTFKENVTHQTLMCFSKILDKKIFKLINGPRKPYTVASNKPGPDLCDIFLLWVYEHYLATKNMWNESLKGDY